MSTRPTDSVPSYVPEKGSLVSLQQLYQDVCRLMSLAYPGLTSDLSNIVARNAFLEALGDNALRVRILVKGPPDLDGALRIARQLQPCDGGSSTAEHRSPPGEKQRSPKSLHSSTTDRYERTRSVNRTVLVRMSSQFQEGLKDCLSQMTAYKLEMENLRRGVQEEETERQRPPSQHSGYKETTFPLSNGNHGGKAPAGGSKGGHGNGSGHGASAQSRSSGQGKSGGQGDWVSRGPCYKCGGEDTLQGTVHCKKGARTSRPSSHKVEPRHSSHISKLQPECSMNHGFSSWDSRPRSQLTTVHWKGKQYNALLDTGCERSVVGKRPLPSGTELSPPTNHLYAANRTKIPLIGCTTINFSVRGKEYTADLAVTDTVDELILGIDWLMNNSLQWDFGRGTIRLGNRWYKLRIESGDFRPRRCSDLVRRNLPVSLTALVWRPTIELSSPSRPDGWQFSRVWLEILVAAKEGAEEIE